MLIAASLVIYILAIYFENNRRSLIEPENVGAIIPLLEQRRNLLVGPNRCDRFVCRPMQFDKVSSRLDRLNV